MKKVFAIFINSIIFCGHLWAAAPADSVHSLREVLVTEHSARNRVMHARLGSETLDLKQLNAAPQIFGEKDIIKTIALMPGVRSENEGMGGFEVRGGSAYENLILLDGMTLYNPAHMMGIFSTFNDDAMSRAILHKGPIPACFGGAVSSALETTMRIGDLNDYHASATVGLLSAKVAAEGPLLRDKLSMAVAARRSYADLIIGLNPSYRNNKGYFYDFNAKLHWTPNNYNTVDFNAFRSSDNNDMAGLMYLRWSNSAASLNWTALAGERWRFISTVAATHYNNDLAQTLLDMKQRVLMYIHDYAFNERAVFNINEANSLDFGLRSQFFNVQSGEMQVNSQTMRQRRSAWDNAAWAAYDGQWQERVFLSAGLRAHFFKALGGSTFNEFISPDEAHPDHSPKLYTSFEPRVSLKYAFSEQHNVKAGYSTTSQALHFLRTSLSSFPFDRMALSSASIAPEKARQLSLAYAGMSNDGAWDWSVEAYTKKLENVYDYRDGFNIFSRVNIESIILPGKGRSKGVELMLRRNTGRITGWIAYTLSKTETKIPGINEDKWYAASNDRRHDISIVGTYALSKKWNLSATWNYLSGKPLTVPEGKYMLDGQLCYYYSARNSYLTPPSHRLDVAASYTKNYKKLSSILAFGIYNVYARQNPFIIYFDADKNNPESIEAKQLSLFAFLPSISYTIKF